MDLELVASLWMKTRLGPAPGDVGINVHDEHGACLARENVQVIDEQLAALGSERCIEVMRHETLRSLVVPDVVHSELGAAGARSVR
jgi:hypothetical protein